MNSKTALDFIGLGFQNLTELHFSAPRRRQSSLIFSTIGGLELVLTAIDAPHDSVDLAASVAYVYDSHSMIPLGVFLDRHYERAADSATEQQRYLLRCYNQNDLNSFMNSVQGLVRSELAPVISGGSKLWKKLSIPHASL